MNENILAHVMKRDAQWEALRAQMLKSGYTRVFLKANGEDCSVPCLWIRPAFDGAPRGMVILCAGGAFRYKTANEVIPTDNFYRRQGFNTAILDYTVDHEAECMDPSSISIRLTAGREALSAVRYVREHADLFNTIPDKIALAGFSAGGITCQYAATMFADDLSDRPDAVLLLYGAFSLTTRVYGTDYNAEAFKKAARYDPLRNIGPDCPPTFIFQTNVDDPRNGLLYALELANHGIPHEIHTFTDGRHGGAMYNGECESPDIPHTAKWAELSADWLKGLGF